MNDGYVCVLPAELSDGCAINSVLHKCVERERERERERGGGREGGAGGLGGVGGGKKIQHPVNRDAYRLGQEDNTSFCIYEGP